MQCAWGGRLQAWLPKSLTTSTPPVRGELMGETRNVLSAEQYALVTAPIETARTLPREAFFSRSFYEAEVERIYARRWVGVLFEFEVAEPGDALPFECCGIPLVAVRGSDRKLRVFHNIVPYDGCLAVMEAARGLEQIETPYHGWVYDLFRLVAAGGSAVSPRSLRFIFSHRGNLFALAAI